MAQHMIESYASVAGLKISKPFIQTQYFPLECEKYILVNSGGRASGKLYPLYSDVIRLLKPIVEQHGYSFVQIGSPEDTQIAGAADLRGKTNLHQSAYLIQNCELLLSNDTSCMHIASGFDKKLVAIFGTTAPANHGPIFGDKNNQICIESHRYGNKPSFAADESPRTINTVKVEDVCAAVLKLLNLENNITQKTLFVGDGYFGGHEIHLIPDQKLDPNAVAIGQVHLRADLFFHPQLIIENLQLRKYVLWLDREIDLEILKQLKPNIEAVVFQVDDDVNIEFLKKIQRLGIGLNLFTKLPVDEHNKLKISMLDLPLVGRHENISLETVKENIKKYQNTTEPPELNKEYFYYSKKHYLSSGKIFNSLYDFKHQKNVENIEQFGRADFNNQDFLNEISSFLIFQSE